ncbi:MAG: RDD family protein [Actinobacteria bacterium]|nr:RDD family protein [Actinomycetota bacterium]
MTSPPGPPEDDSPYQPPSYRPPPPPVPPPPAAGPSAYGPPPSAYPPAGPTGGEGPVDGLGRPLAAWGQRVAAFVIDEIFIFVVTYCAVFAFGLRQRFTGVLLSLALAAAYFAILNGSAAGQTFGKRVVGIAVRDGTTGESIGVERAALRYIFVGLFRLVPFFGLFALLDGLWPLWDPRRHALHDKIVGSVVIRVSPS